MSVTRRKREVVLLLNNVDMSLATLDFGFHIALEGRRSWFPTFVQIIKLYLYMVLDVFRVQMKNNLYINTAAKISPLM
jgi:hypothetical protein